MMKLFQTLLKKRDISLECHMQLSLLPLIKKTNQTLLHPYVSSSLPPTDPFSPLDHFPPLSETKRALWPSYCWVLLLFLVSQAFLYKITDAFRPSGHAPPSAFSSTWRRRCFECGQVRQSSDWSFKVWGLLRGMSHSTTSFAPKTSNFFCSCGLESVSDIFFSCLASGFWIKSRRTSPTIN